MLKEAYDRLKNFQHNELTVYSALWGDKQTLIYGYNCDRKTVHVYVMDGLIHKIVYNGNKLLSHESKDKWEAKELVPNKRVYWDRSQYAFCSLCITHGISIAFTDLYVDNPDGYPSGCHVFGKTLEDFEGNLKWIRV